MQQTVNVAFDVGFMSVNFFLFESVSYKTIFILK